MITKTELDKLVEKYETIDFIENDPIQFPHRGKCKEEIELYGFIASLFAYGNRKIFIKKLDEIFSKAEGDLLGYIRNGDFSSLRGVEYRFSKENDIVPIFEILSKLYNKSKGLEELFEYGWSVSALIPPSGTFSHLGRRIDIPSPLVGGATHVNNLQAGYNIPSPLVGGATHVNNLQAGYNIPSPLVGEGERSSGEGYKIFLQTIIDYFYSNAPKTVSQGFYHMIPNPSNGGAMKRMNMFLRWMVRKGPVDLGIWNFIQPKHLLIPLDVHVARVSRNMSLLTRKSNDFKAVIELTNTLREFSPDDPVKYDFAMFGFGVQ